MEEQITELVSFLRDKRPEARLMATEGVQGLTGSTDGIRLLLPHIDSLLTALFLLVPDQASCSRPALTSLVNLSQDTDMASSMQKLRAVNRIMDYLREGTCPHVHLLVMLLCNLTTQEAGCRDLLQLENADLKGFNVAHCACSKAPLVFVKMSCQIRAVLLQRFIATPPASKDDPYEYLAMVFMNIARLQSAREMLLEPGRGFLAAVASQLDSPALLRRRGCAGVVRNCCLNAEEDGQLEGVLAEEQWLRQVLLRLAGDDEVGINREGDEQAREALAEAVLLLAKTESGRRALWDLDAPQLLKRGYEFEEHEGTCEAMERTAQLFLQDHGQVQEATTP